MKRKVIQIGNSTQLVSIPRSWAKKFDIKRGDEIEVTEENSRLVISTNNELPTEKIEMDLSRLGIMIPRCIHALYKRGADEIRFTFEDPTLIRKIQESLGKEAVGFEIIDQGKNHCVIKHVAGEFEDFEPVLRRTFLLLLSMSDDILAALKKKEYEQLPTIAYLEETNNRFTTACRRYLNRKAYKELSKTGALYYIVEDLEKMADELKYLCQYVYERHKEKDFKLSSKTMEVFEQTNQLLRNFYELFYKFDEEKLAQIAFSRKKQVLHILALLEASATRYDTILLHHMLTITQKTFNYLGPYLIMAL